MLSETPKNLVVNSMEIDLNMLGPLMEGEIVGDEDGHLIITKH